MQTVRSVLPFVSSRIDPDQRKAAGTQVAFPVFGFSEFLLDSQVDAALLSRIVPSRQEGRLAIVTNAGRDAMDASLRKRRMREERGRRSRVVLAPRRWCQVGEMISRRW